MELAEKIHLEFEDLNPERLLSVATYLEFVTHTKTLGIAPQTAEGYISWCCQKGWIRQESQGLIPIR